MGRGQAEAEIDLAGAKNGVGIGHPFRLRPALAEDGDGQPGLAHPVDDGFPVQLVRAEKTQGILETGVRRFRITLGNVNTLRNVNAGRALLLIPSAGNPGVREVQVEKGRPFPVVIIRSGKKSGKASN